LHFASKLGTKEVTELLMQKGADVNATKDDDSTPLDMAIKHKRTEIANFLRKHGGKTGAELKAAGN
jgi:ankyrin repeat protein